MRAALKAKVRARKDAIEYERKANKRAIREFVVKEERIIGRIPNDASGAKWLGRVQENLAQAASEGETHWSQEDVPLLGKVTAETFKALWALRHDMGGMATEFAADFSDTAKRLEMAIDAARIRYITYWRNHSDVSIASDEQGLHFDWSE